MSRTAKARMSSVRTGLASVLWSADLLLHLTSWLRVVDLHRWRRVCSDTRRACTALVRSRVPVDVYWRTQLAVWGGAAPDENGGSLIGALRQLQADTDAVVTGSSVVHYFSGNDAIHARDLDVFLTGTARNFRAFLAFFRSIVGDRKWRPWLLIKRNNLRAPRDAEETEFAAAAFTRWSGPRLRADDNYRRGREEKQEEEENHDVAVVHRGVSEGGYTKHTNLLAYTVCLVEASTAAACSCRTVYDVEGAGCPATHRTVDIVFVARNVAPDIYTALERIFDLDICVAAVGRERVRCHAPDGLANNRAAFRFHSYCRAAAPGPVSDDLRRLKLCERGPEHDVAMAETGCLCDLIIVARINKYQERGYGIAVE